MTIKNCTDYISSHPSVGSSQALLTCFDENQDSLFDISAGFARSIGPYIFGEAGELLADRIEGAANVQNGALSLPEMIGDIGNLAEKIEDCWKVFSKTKANHPRAFIKKAHVIRSLIGQGVDSVITTLSFTNFLHQQEVFNLSDPSLDGITVAAEGLKVMSSVNGIVDNVFELVEVGQREETNPTEYRIHVNNMTKWKAIWGIVKNIACITGSVLALLGLITGVVCSSWIILGLAIFIFIASIRAFFIEDQLKRYQHHCVMNKIKHNLAN